jgi:hypothetical protein
MGPRLAARPTSSYSADTADVWDGSATQQIRRLGPLHRQPGRSGTGGSEMGGSTVG